MANKTSLSGSKGCGKSAVANQILRKHQDTDPVILSFAQPLKIFLTELLQEGNDPTVVYEAMYGDKDNTFVSTKRISRQTIEYAMIGLVNSLKVTQITNKFIQWAQESGLIVDSISGRELLQKVGTEFFRHRIRDTFWVDLMQQSILENEGCTIVVDDTRFPDEFRLLKSMGFVMLNIINPEENIKDSHISENSLNGVSFDLTFINDKSLGKENIINFVENNL